MRLYGNKRSSGNPAISIPQLNPLGLSGSSLPENTGPGVLVGALTNTRAGSLFSLIDSASNRFAVSGLNINTGSVSTDFEVATSHTITVRETNAGYANSPRDTILTITVSNVLEGPSLNALALSSTSFVVGTPSSGSINGATATSAVVAAGLPAGLTVNGPARTWGWDGTGSVSTPAITLTETIADGPNSPRVSNINLTIVAAPASKLIIAVLAGQSNMEGRALRTAGTDVDVANVWQFGGWSGKANYRTFDSDITPINHYTNYTEGNTPTYLGPGEYIARKLLADNVAGTKVVLVGTAQGSTGMVNVANDLWRPGPTNGSGGSLFENMITQANAAVAAAPGFGAFSGATIEVQFYFVQGEQDANYSVTKAAYLASLTNFIAYARARVTGASNAAFVIGSMVPEKWLLFGPENAGAYLADYAAINEAHVVASLNIAGVKYVMGPTPLLNNDNLHYFDSSVTLQEGTPVRTFGTSMAAAFTDSVGPIMTSANSFSVTTGNVLSFALSANDSHQTYEIVAGGNAALFELSDPYLSPKLRWAGNGTGPAVGTYTVGVRARDGAGNFGATQTITATVAAAGAVSPVSFFTASERGMVWDLSNLANMAQTIDGVTPVTAAGQSVGWVKDLSPNANHWVALANDTTRPTYQVDGNGKGYLQFDGVNDRLVAPVPFVGGLNALRYSVVLGAFGNNADINRHIIGNQSTASTTPFIEPIVIPGTAGALNLSLRNDGGGGVSPTFASTAGVFDGATVRLITSASDGTNSTLRQRLATARPAGGGSGGYTQVTQGTFGTAAAVTRAALGARGFATAQQFFGGRIYSGFAINRFITDAEIRDGENWVAGLAAVSVP